MDRRDSLRTLAAAAVAPALWPGLLAPRDLLALADRAPRVLDARQLATINAVAQRIIPATHTPGAGDVHVEQFVDLMLSDWYTAADRERLLAGLAALDGFLDGPPERQTTLLQSLDDAAAGKLDQGKPDHWFGMLKYLIVWGYCTSQAAQTQELGQWPLPWRYDGNAPYRA
jgi:gluconate 2-dehydrogenase gamma chain